MINVNSFRNNEFLTLNASSDIIYSTYTIVGTQNIHILYSRVACSFRIPMGAPSKTCNLEALCAFLWVIRDLRRGMRVQ